MKTVLLGMNSPTGRVLEYDNGQSAGGRLFALSGMSRMVYEISFKRMNLLETKEWDDAMARAAGAQLQPILGKNYRNVVVLGDKVWKALGFGGSENWLESRQILGQAKFWKVPHTSGRCLFYNDENNCRAVTRLLMKLASEGGE